MLLGVVLAKKHRFLHMSNPGDYDADDYDDDYEIIEIDE